MKNMQVLSLLLLLSCGQMYGSANPDLAFILAYQNIDAMSKNITSDNNDIHAAELLSVMNESIEFDAMQQQALNAAKDGYLSEGVPLDQEKIAADNQALKKKIKKLKHNINKFEKDGVQHWEKKKINKRRKARDKKEDLLDENLDKLEAIKDAKAAEESINNLREKNTIILDEALESYIATFGQCYVKSGSMYGVSIIISSNEDQNLAITHNQYDQLMATLQKAANQFPSVVITLDIENSDEDIEVSISDVASYINNMPKSSGSWTMFAAKAAVGAAVAIGTAGIAYNLYQGEDWNSSAAYDAALETPAGQKLQELNTQAQNAASQAYENAMESSYGQSAQEKAQYAQSKAEEASNAILNSSYGQSIINAFGYDSPAQQEAAQEALYDSSMAAADEAAFDQYFG